MNVPVPSAVHISDATQTVQITWDDGHQSTYPWWYLRGFCPCAVCQGHQAGTTFISNDVPPALTRMDEVGFYALNIVWDTNHTTGIYTFEYLRRLCPCSICRQSLGPTHPGADLPAPLAAGLSQA